MARMEQASPARESLLSVAELSAQLQVPRAYARQLVRSGQLGAIVRNRSGHLLVQRGALAGFRVDPEDLRRFGRKPSDSELFWLYEVNLPQWPLR